VSDDKLIDYLGISNSPINATHEIGFLATPYNVKEDYHEAQANGGNVTRIDSMIKSQIVKRKQVMQALHKEIRELEQLI